MFIPKVIIRKKAYRQLMSCVYATGLRYETGGMLLGYRFMRIFYIISITFPRRPERATRTTFILNGEEHTEDAEKIMGRFIPHLQLIGIWHSHTTEDNSFSLQDKETNKKLVEQIGRMLSVIIIPHRESNDIRMVPYYISVNRGESLCKFIIRRGGITMGKITVGQVGNIQIKMDVQDDVYYDAKAPHVSLYRKNIMVLEHLFLDEADRVVGRDHEETNAIKWVRDNRWELEQKYKALNRR